MRPVGARPDFGGRRIQAGGRETRHGRTTNAAPQRRRRRRSLEKGQARRVHRPEQDSNRSPVSPGMDFGRKMTPIASRRFSRGLACSLAAVLAAVNRSRKMPGRLPWPGFDSTLRDAARRALRQTRQPPPVARPQARFHKPTGREHRVADRVPHSSWLLQNPSKGSRYSTHPASPPAVARAPFDSA